MAVKAQLDGLGGAAQQAVDRWAARGRPPGVLQGRRGGSVFDRGWLRQASQRALGSWLGLLMPVQHAAPLLSGLQRLTGAPTICAHAAWLDPRGWTTWQLT